MNAATILKLKGRSVVTTTLDKSLLDIAKLLAQHGIGCIVIVGDNDNPPCRGVHQSASG
jgi:CBS domain-containing protein